MGYRIYPKRDLSDTSHLFHFQLSALKLVTMWKPENKRYYIPFMLVYTWNIVILAIATVGLLVKGCTTKDLVDRSEAMDIFTLVGSALYKMVFFICYHEELIDMVTCGLALVEKLPAGWTKHCNLFSKIHCCGGFGAMTFWGLCPIMKWMYGESTLEEMKWAINAYDPFESTGALFFIIYCLCVYALIVSAHIYMAADCYLFTSIYVAVGGLQRLNDMLNDTKDFSNDKHITDGSNVDRMHDHLKECMEIHVHILDYVRKTDKLFRSMILADVVHAIISLSFAMLQASESKGLFESIKMVAFVVVCFLHQFLNSHFGQELIAKQDNLARQILVAIPWTEASRTFKKSYHIMLTGNKDSFKLSAWKVYVLQYATFLEFSKSMISYYMVLRQLQDEAVEVA